MRLLGYFAFSSSLLLGSVCGGLVRGMCEVTQSQCLCSKWCKHGLCVYNTSLDTWSQDSAWSWTPAHTVQPRERSLSKRCVCEHLMSTPMSHSHSERPLLPDICVVSHTALLLFDWITAWIHRCTGVPCKRLVTVWCRQRSRGNTDTWKWEMDSCLYSTKRKTADINH